MTTKAPAAPRYALSFTSGALLVREALVTAPLYLHERDWRKVRERIQRDNLLQSRTLSSGSRLAREVVQRLSVFEETEIELLTECTTSERGHLMWAAACRRYDLIGEFAEEVLRERFLLRAESLEHHDFDAFLRTKALWHPEISELKVSTMHKLRSTVFLMLIEAGLLSEEHRILRPTFSSHVSDALAARSPSDNRFFPIEGFE